MEPLNEKTEIDKKIEALLEKDLSTHGQMRAMIEGYRLWDAELKRIDEQYGRLQGTMYQPMRLAARMELIKSRALALQSYQKLGRE